MKRPAKATNERVTTQLLQDRAAWSERLGYSKQKWVLFCEVLLKQGYEITLYEARETVSKYLTVRHGGKSFKVRFSNHKPIKAREARGDCDFFVGITHQGRTTTEQAIVAVQEFFNGRN